MHRQEKNKTKVEKYVTHPVIFSYEKNNKNHFIFRLKSEHKFKLGAWQIFKNCIRKK